MPPCESVICAEAEFPLELVVGRATGFGEEAFEGKKPGAFFLVVVTAALVVVVLVVITRPFAYSWEICSPYECWSR